MPTTSRKKVSCFISCCGTKSLVKHKQLHNTNRLVGRTLSSYSTYNKRLFVPRLQKLASTHQTNKTTCQLHTLIASPSRDLFQLFHNSAVDNHYVGGLMFLLKGSVLCLDTPSMESSLFIDLNDVHSTENSFQRMKLTHIILDLHLGMSDLVEDCQACISNLVVAAKNCQLRLILLSSIGAGDSVCVVPAEIAPVIRQHLKTQTRAEHLVRNSGIVYTILRLGPLEDRLKTGHAVVTESPKGYGSISKQDLVDIIFKAMTSKHAENRTLSCLDSQRTFQMSPYMRPLEFWEPLPFERFEL
ncbi:hypothetical protein GpartN1_g2417.t1 [Galdieria partita]|uniref:NAD(P)-binding domain-containing protein n=1 Tax=Galdieria partita TaxID=83374 RepID=A0A9C7PU87_9RHOD|nr:hypothetical protein GpartN1_g2417.t1 [Galdieria partita]